MKSRSLGTAVGGTLAFAVGWAAMNGMHASLALQWISSIAFAAWAVIQLARDGKQLRELCYTGALLLLVLFAVAASHAAGAHLARQELIDRLPEFEKVASGAARELGAGREEVRLAPPIPNVAFVLARRDPDTGGTAVQFGLRGQRRGVVIFVDSIREPHMKRNDRCLRPLRKNYYEYYYCP